MLLPITRFSAAGCGSRQLSKPAGKAAEAADKWWEYVKAAYNYIRDPSWGNKLTAGWARRNWNKIKEASTEAANHYFEHCGGG